LVSALEILGSLASDAITPDVARALAGLDNGSASEVQHGLATLVVELQAELDIAVELGAGLAGARLARLLVLSVPLVLGALGVALVGPGAYATPLGERLVALALLTLLGCWLWASSLLVPLVARHRHCP